MTVVQAVSALVCDRGAGCECAGVVQAVRALVCDRGAGCECAGV